MLRSLSVAILLLTVAVGCERKPPPAAPTPAAPPVKTAVSVLNADVFVIDGKHVRLAGVYAPQPVPDARCWAEALAAKQATRAVAAMVQRAGSVTWEPTGALDEYNREIGAVQLDGADLGDLLVAEGMGARPQKARFEWCDPVSRNEPGAPKITSMMETVPGRAP